MLRSLLLIVLLALTTASPSAQKLPWDPAEPAPVPGAPIETPQLTLLATSSAATPVTAGKRLLRVEVTPKPGMHVYAPGKHEYQVIRLTVDPQPWLRAADTRYPPSRVYEFVPLNERVEVYSTPFRLERELTILATNEARKSLAGKTSATVTGRVAYQACDDKVCYAPRTVPVQWTVDLKP